ncbi:uncharacterized protein LOC142624224 [Castanea sativa]|uniref:uncharacterized protein LOC142624224 n=1 Tax=Castanea sativa TaxID=21020 RepID=UPI003F649F57
MIDLNGLRDFIMLPLWTGNDFRSTITEFHFKTLKAKYQIPDNVRLRHPHKSEKCYYRGVDGVGIYEQALKAGLRFPLSSLHRQLLQYLGLSITQISPNAWRVFIGVEVLYGAMSNGARRLTVKEFFHYYNPTEIVKSKGMYSFVAKGPLLRLVCDTPDSNRDWKTRDRPQVTLEEWSFLERIFNKTKLEERTWAQLVTLDTLHWYCDGPEPTSAAHRYNSRVRKQMDAAKRRAFIKQQAAKKKQEVGQAKGTVPSKRSQPEKMDRLPKKQKTTPEPVVADSGYALERLSSIMTADDYEDLGNHATEAMGETGLFTIAHAMLMMKGLMGRCLNHETTMDRLRKKNKTMEDELHDLKT